MGFKIGKRFCVLTCSPPGSQSAAITTPLCPDSALKGVLSTENSSLSSVSVPKTNKTQIIETYKLNLDGQRHVTNHFNL